MKDVLREMRRQQLQRNELIRALVEEGIIRRDGDPWYYLWPVDCGPGKVVYIAISTAHTRREIYAHTVNP